MVIGEIINVTGYIPEHSELRIEISKKDGERFVKEILPEIMKAGYVEVYKKRKYSYYLFTQAQVALVKKLCKLYIVKR